MVYAYVSMNINNPDSLAQYRELAADALEKHGGSVLIAGKENIVLEGDATAPDIAAVLSFPDNASARAWMDDPELNATHNLRRGSGEVSTLLIA